MVMMVLDSCTANVHIADRLDYVIYTEAGHDMFSYLPDRRSVAE
jgi:hypothetical protein